MAKEYGEFDASRKCATQQSCNTTGRPMSRDSEPRLVRVEDAPEGGRGLRCYYIRGTNLDEVFFKDIEIDIGVGEVRLGEEKADSHPSECPAEPPADCPSGGAECKGE